LAQAPPNGAHLSFYQNGSGTTPYSNNILAAPGPFVGQAGNAINYGIDACKISFINT